MNVLDLIHAAANDGVFLLRSGDNLRVVGLGTRVKVWAPRLRLVKDKLLEVSHPAANGSIDEIAYAVDLIEDLMEAFQERAAIMQFDGGLPQDLAERMAAHSVFAPYSAIPTRLNANRLTTENDLSRKKECP